MDSRFGTMVTGGTGEQKDPDAGRCGGISASFLQLLLFSEENRK